MLPGTARPITLPPDYTPPEPGYVDISLATYMMMMGRVERISTQQIREMNRKMHELGPTKIWNSCNGFIIPPGSELSLDATPHSHHFVNKSASKPQPRRRQVSIKHYFEEKYKIRLNYPNSPLLRDPSGSMFPIETVWFRYRVF
ncbi:hypothetical protein GCK72_016119 [Caenorhabditis remanei]|uniref:Uncharacterized protein n=1 Tax=Caenorhabditis remanei TaxID=31234 RepID=A0A6A5GZC6_CAERE|nr:hypothetical protein GCK72_016119 [Caenorhabditis remanei]KAF1759652.1 hypothetical protein GCK72_016119 [Caenorhabditis remanei]